MNETKHTPGPWTVAYGMVYRSIAQGALGAGIAKMDRDEEMTSPTERDANAQLIAAAPELLAACQNGLRAMRALGWDQSPLESQYFKDYAATASAIYKATKQSSSMPV